MRISDWSSYVCSSDLAPALLHRDLALDGRERRPRPADRSARGARQSFERAGGLHATTSPCSGPSGQFVATPLRHVAQIGRASCRERVCQYVAISVVPVTYTNKTSTTTTHGP